MFTITFIGTAEALKILHIEIPDKSEVPINNVVQVHEEKRPFPKIKGVKIHIHLKPGAVPVHIPLRRAPAALEKKVKEQLDELLAMDIIEKVDGPSAWISALVPIIKNCGGLRLCVDLRRLNDSIQREHHPLPNFEEIIPNLRNAKVFSILDIKSAYHQCELDEASRPLTTFITQYGRFRYKRLVFGVSCAPEQFQRVMDSMLSDCKNVVCFIDDILVHGATFEEHDECLTAVLKVLKENDVLLNTQKCRMRLKEVVFLGHKLSSRGIEPLESKLSAVRQFRAPQTKEELRSFLGLVCYIGRFIPDLATLTDPLRQLLKKDAVFVWEELHQKVFEQIKSTCFGTLGYFDPTRKTRLIADASPVGLGAVLIQFDDKEPVIISYAAKSLTDAERKYCQPEKEALALVWAVERFRYYLLGISFEMETDHKALETIFASKNTACARIERWALRVQAFRFKVVYRKGKSNLADPLSRLPVRSPEPFDENSDAYINEICVSAAVDIKEVELASEADEVLQLLKTAIDNRNFDHEQLTAFKYFKDQLSYSGNVLIRGDKIIVPSSLRNRFLELGHEGHPGETLMKRRLRMRCWWPKMDDDIQKFVKNCKGCLLVSVPSKPEPMSRRKLPNAPWVDCAIDFMGPLPTGEYLLVIIDYFSRYMEVEIMTTITAEATIERLDVIFTRFGPPHTITLDNGRQFVSNKFHEFCKLNGVYLNHTAPYWPQANGEVERQNRSLLKRLQIGHALHGEWRKELRRFLVMYNTTPHTVTNRTPTEIMFGRTIRGKLPHLFDLETAPVRDQIVDRDTILKEKGKERADEKRGAKKCEIEQGDTVLTRNLVKQDKLTTRYAGEEYKVLERRGPVVTIQNEDTGNVLDRNVAHVIKVPDAEVPAEERRKREIRRPQRYLDDKVYLIDYTCIEVDNMVNFVIKRKGEM